MPAGGGRLAGGARLANEPRLRGSELLEGEADGGRGEQQQAAGFGVGNQDCCSVGRRSLGVRWDAD